MVLYKKVFPLGKGISFSQYITAIKKECFPNFVVTIDKILATENYRVQIFFTAQLWRWGFANAFREGVLLKECTIQLSEDEEYFTIQASPKAENLFFALFYITSGVLLFTFVLSTMIAHSTISFSNIFTLAIITIILLVPAISIYLRDKKLLDKVGYLGTEFEKN